MLDKDEGETRIGGLNGKAGEMSGQSDKHEEE